MSHGLKIKTIVDTFGHWDDLYELYRVSRRAHRIQDQYNAYPSTPDALPAWQEARDSILDEVYQISGAEPKY